VTLAGESRKTRRASNCSMVAKDSVIEQMLQRSNWIVICDQFKLWKGPMKG
jgi:hypothetical protein